MGGGVHVLVVTTIIGYEGMLFMWLLFMVAGLGRDRAKTTSSPFTPKETEKKKSRS